MQLGHTHPLSTVPSLWYHQTVQTSYLSPSYRPPLHFHCQHTHPIVRTWCSFLHIKGPFNFNLLSSTFFKISPTCLVVLPPLPLSFISLIFFITMPNDNNFMFTAHHTPGAKTINVFRACLGAQLTICAQRWRNFVLFSTVSLRFVLSQVSVFLYSLGPSCSRIISRLRTPVSWSSNQCPPIFSILETFRSEDFFQRCVLSLQVAIDVI